MLFFKEDDMFEETQFCDSKTVTLKLYLRVTEVHVVSNKKMIFIDSSTFIANI